MGTVFSIEIPAPSVPEAALDAVIQWLHWVDDTFSTYQSMSQLSMLGRGEITLGDCSPEVTHVLSRCVELENQTNGFFSARADGTLDPSGFVKGWAIQRASEMLRAAGSANHCVNGGGDVQCAGNAAAGQPWRIGIAHPLQKENLAGIVCGHDVAVATSGSAERGGHVLDPHTRRSPTDLISVTMVGRDLETVDAYATAAFAMGSRACEWISSLENYRALVMYADGTEWSSPGFAGPF